MLRVITESSTGTNTVTTSTSIYASGDQVGTVLEYAYAVREITRTAFITDVVVVDKDKQKAEIDLFLFNASPTVTSVDNGAFSLSDTEISTKSLVHVTITADDYKDTALNSVASVSFLKLVQAAAGSRSVFVIPVVRGTPTFTSTSALIIKISFAQD
jgi:hypothetical protein